MAALEDVPTFLIGVLVERVEVAPKRAGEERDILAYDSLNTTLIMVAQCAREVHTIRLRRSSRPMVVMSIPSMLRGIREHSLYFCVMLSHPHDMPLHRLDDP